MLTETLHQSITRTALLGASKRKCPGGYIAYIGKREDECSVVYLHQHTDKRIHDMTWRQTREFVSLGVEG